MNTYLRLAILSQVAVALLVVLLLRPRTRVTPENYDRVAVGTSRSDAEAILGTPVTERDAGGNLRPEGTRELAWEGTTGKISVLVDKSGRVVNRVWIPADTAVERRPGD
jgi:hypothetical protein